MRKFFFGLGVLFAVLLVAAAGGIGYMVYAASALDRECRAYVDTSVVAIVRGWSAAELAKRATPGFLEDVRPAGLQPSFDRYAKLGALLAYQGSQGEATVAAMLGGDRTVSANYVSRARFAAGDAVIETNLLKVGGHWMINGFRVIPAGAAEPLGESL